MDFDFKDGRRHYKGRGTTGLVGLGMLLVIRPLMWIVGLGFVYWLRLPLIEAIRVYLASLI